MTTQKHKDTTIATISIVVGFDERLPGFGDGKIPRRNGAKLCKMKRDALR